MDLGWMAFIAVTFKTLSKCHHLPVVPGAIFPAGSLKRVALFGWYFWGGSFFWVAFWMKDLARTFLNGPSNLRPKESDFELVNVSLEISRTFCRSFLPGWDRFLELGKLRNNFKHARDKRCSWKTGVGLSLSHIESFECWTKRCSTKNPKLTDFVFDLHFHPTEIETWSMGTTRSCKKLGRLLNAAESDSPKWSQVSCDIIGPALCSYTLQLPRNCSCSSRWNGMETTLNSLLGICFFFGCEDFSAKR